MRRDRATAGEGTLGIFRGKRWVNSSSTYDEQAPMPSLEAEVITATGGSDDDTRFMSSDDFDSISLKCECKM